LRGKDLKSNVLFVEQCRSAAMSDVLRVHEWSYVRKVQATCEGEALSPSPATLTSLSPHSELASRFGQSLSEEGGEDEEAEHDLGIAHLDSDTAISKRSFDAALFAAGSLCQAVDMVSTSTHLSVSLCLS
jgi:acetoin utilization deacetylase AcuC-like enzyme